MQDAPSTGKYVKFTGRFRDLISHGFKFQKLFARNYRCYHYRAGGSYSPNVWVWQHLGGYVEFDSLFTDKSVLVVEAIIAGRAEQGGVNNPYHRSGSKIVTFHYNLKTGALHDYDFKKTGTGCAIELFKECYEKQKAGVEDAMKPYDEAIGKHYDEWEEVTLTPGLVEAIKDMIQVGIIDIFPDNRPRR